MERHDPMCKTNISCAVYHSDGICPDRDVCTCKPMKNTSTENCCGEHEANLAKCPHEHINCWSHYENNKVCICNCIPCHSSTTPEQVIQKMKNDGCIPSGAEPNVVHASTPEWEKEFASKFSVVMNSEGELAIDFIRETLSNQKQEMKRKIEALRIDVMNGGCGIKEHTHHKPKFWTRNTTIDDILSALELE